MIEAGSSELIIQESIDLKPFNSLAISAIAQHFCGVENITQLKMALSFAKTNNLKITPIGGGSNLVLAGDIDGLVIHIDLKGVTAEAISKTQVDIKFAAGENWHAMVGYCLENQWYGLENLALIPGNMGAAPIQNIGAYGVELCDFLQSVEVINLATAEVETLSARDCQFGYRTSLFKKSAKDRYIILSVTLRLSTVAQVNSEYPSLKLALASNQPTPEDIYQTVCKIRRVKLPDPAQIPNVGSFFKNPIIASEVANALAIDYPELPIYPHTESTLKVSAAWLIEHCGFKGYRKGNVGVHHNQALVLVNYQGNGEDMLALADEIMSKVFQKFSVRLELEPRVYGVAD